MARGQIGILSSSPRSDWWTEPGLCQPFAWVAHPERCGPTRRPTSRPGGKSGSKRTGGPAEPRWEEVGPKEPACRHFVAHSEPTALFIQDAVTGDIRKVANFGAQDARSDPQALRCSAPHDVTFAAPRRVPIPFSAVRRITMSTDAVSELGFEPEESWGDIVFSNDGALVGVGCSHQVWRYGEGHPPQFAVYAVDSGALLARGIASFSDDNSRILSVRRPDTGDSPVVWSMLEWQAGQSRRSMQTSPGTRWTRPGAGAFLVADRSWRLIPDENRREPLEDLWIVRSDGNAQLAVARVLRLG